MLSANILIQCAKSEIGMVLIHIIYLVVQSIVSLMSSLRVISLTVLEESIHNILIFFAEKM